MSNELLEMSVLINILMRTLIANKVLEKEDLLAELSRLQKAIPQSSVANIQELIVNTPSQ